MAKPQKTYPATLMMTRYIKRLVRTGLYGDNESEVAGRLVAMSIRRLIEGNVLKELEPEDEAPAAVVEKRPNGKRPKGGTVAS